MIELLKEIENKNIKSNQSHRILKEATIRLTSYLSSETMKIRAEGTDIVKDNTCRIEFYIKKKSSSRMKVKYRQCHIRERENINLLLADTCYRKL